MVKTTSSAYQRRRYNSDAYLDLDVYFRPTKTKREGIYIGPGHIITKPTEIGLVNLFDHLFPEYREGEYPKSYNSLRYRFTYGINCILYEMEGEIITIDLNITMLLYTGTKINKTPVEIYNKIEIDPYFRLQNKLYKMIANCINESAFYGLDIRKYGSYKSILDVDIPITATEIEFYDKTKEFMHWLADKYIQTTKGNVNKLLTLVNRKVNDEKGKEKDK